MTVEHGSVPLSTPESTTPVVPLESKTPQKAAFIIETMPDFESHNTKEIYSRLEKGDTVRVDPVDAYYLSETDELQPDSGKLIYEKEIHRKPKEVVVFDSEKIAA